MKILKKPTVPYNAWEKVTCSLEPNGLKENGCGAELKIDKKDLVVMWWHGTHFLHHYAAFICPFCGKHNAVKNLPDPIWKNLLKKKEKEAIFSGVDESL